MTDITLQLASWVQQLRAIAQTGLAFSDPPGLDDSSTNAASSKIYNTERYQAILDLTAAMTASINSRATLDPLLAEEFAARWRAEVQPGAAGYMTPKVGTSAIVFNDRDELLMIQRAEGQWFVPTGWAEVGMSPAQVVVKEVREETGFIVTPQRVIGVFDGAKWGATLHPHFYSIMFYCKLAGGALNRHPAETLDAGFFAREKLPSPIFQNRLEWLRHAWAIHHNEIAETYFDA